MKRLSLLCILIVGIAAVHGQSSDLRLQDTPAPIVTDLQASGSVVPNNSLLTQEASPQGKAASNAGEGEQQGGNGTNPADNARRLVLRNEYIELGSGLVVNTTIARLSLPAFGKKGGIYFELPFNYYDPTQSNISQYGGIGDFKVGVSYNFWSSESKKLTLFGGTDFWMPTADNFAATRNPVNNQLSFQESGTGKFRAAPLLGLVYAISPTSIFAPIYQHEFSFAGDSSRATIHRGVVRLFYMNAWKSGVYVLPEAQLIIDYTNKNRLDVFLMPEVGYSKKGSTLFAKPGFGINPGPNNRSIGVNFGIRQDF